jgi:hypothetical protein
MPRSPKIPRKVAGAINYREMHEVGLRTPSSENAAMHAPGGASVTAELGQPFPLPDDGEEEEQQTEIPSLQRHERQRESSTSPSLRQDIIKLELEVEAWKQKSDELRVRTLHTQVGDAKQSYRKMQKELAAVKVKDVDVLPVSVSSVTKKKKDTKCDSDKTSKFQRQAPAPCQGKDIGASTDNLTIGDLRAMAHIEKLVDVRIKALGVLSSDSSSSSDNGCESSSSDDSDDACSHSHVVAKVKRKHKHKASKTRSGIRVKSSDKVRYPQIWPQSMLQFQFVNKSVRYNDLDFNLFVAGELETILAQSISKTEKHGRLELLKKIAYHSTIYPFDVLRDLYAACLRQIETGNASWADDQTQLETTVLSRRFVEGGKSDKSDRVVSSKRGESGRSIAEGNVKTLFCSLFQSDKCKEVSPHDQYIRGLGIKKVSHICATCHTKDGNSLSHHAKSPSCPHRV